jgi:hypothetical protein
MSLVDIVAEKGIGLVEKIKNPEIDFIVSGIAAVAVPLATGSEYSMATGPVCLAASAVNYTYRETSLTYEGLKAAKNLAIAFCRLFY